MIIIQMGPYVDLIAKLARWMFSSNEITEHSWWNMTEKAELSLWEPPKLGKKSCSSCQKRLFQWNDSANVRSLLRCSEHNFFGKANYRSLDPLPSQVANFINNGNEPFEIWSDSEEESSMLTFRRLMISRNNGVPVFVSFGGRRVSEILQPRSTWCGCPGKQAHCPNELLNHSRIK